MEQKLRFFYVVSLYAHSVVVHFVTANIIEERINSIKFEDRNGNEYEHILKNGEIMHICEEPLLTESKEEYPEGIGLDILLCGKDFERIKSGKQTF